MDAFSKASSLAAIIQHITGVLGGTAILGQAGTALLDQDSPWTGMVRELGSIGLVLIFIAIGFFALKEIFKFLEEHAGAYVQASISKMEKEVDTAQENAKNYARMIDVVDNLSDGMRQHGVLLHRVMEMLHALSPELVRVDPGIPGVTEGSGEKTEGQG